MVYGDKKPGFNGKILSAYVVHGQVATCPYGCIRWCHYRLMHNQSFLEEISICFNIVISGLPAPTPR